KKRDAEGGKRGERGRRGIGGRKEQGGKDEHRRGAVDVEVEKLDRRPDEARKQDLRRSVDPREAGAVQLFDLAADPRGRGAGALPGPSTLPSASVTVTSDPFGRPSFNGFTTATILSPALRVLRFHPVRAIMFGL